jgi:hypothetical protein
MEFALTSPVTNSFLDATLKLGHAVVHDLLDAAGFETVR